MYIGIEIQKLEGEREVRGGFVGVVVFRKRPLQIGSRWLLFHGGAPIGVRLRSTCNVVCICEWFLEIEREREGICNLLAGKAVDEPG